MVWVRFAVTDIKVLESAGTVNLTIESEGESAKNFTILLTTANGTARGLSIKILLFCYTL